MANRWRGARVALKRSLSVEESPSSPAAMADVVRAVSLERAPPEAAAAGAAVRVAILLLDEGYPPSRIVKQLTEKACQQHPTASVEPVVMARVVDGTTAHVSLTLNADLLIIDYGTKPQNPILSFQISQRQRSADRPNVWTLVLYQSERDWETTDKTATHLRYHMDGQDVVVFPQQGDEEPATFSGYLESLVSVGGGWPARKTPRRPGGAEARVVALELTLMLTVPRAAPGTRSSQHKAAWHCRSCSHRDLAGNCEQGAAGQDQAADLPGRTGARQQDGQGRGAPEGAAEVGPDAARRPDAERFSQPVHVAAGVP